MAFCGTCGTKLNGQAFCPNCGTPVGNEVMVSGNTSVIYGQPKSERQMALDELDAIKEHFNFIFPEYAEHLAKTLELEMLKKKKILRWIFTMPLWFLGALFTVDFIPTRFLQVIYLLASVILPIVIPIRRKKQTTQKIKNLEKEADELAEKVVAHYNSYNGECPIGLEFYNLPSLDEIRNIITSGRANTIQQALNLMLDDRHKESVEQRLSQTLDAAETAASYAKDAAENSKAAARSAEKAYWNTL